MKILIAGSKGVIGSYLYSKLRDKDYNVFGLDLKDFDEQNYISVNLLNTGTLIDKLKSLPYFDIIIFFIALAHDKGKNKEIDDFRKINLATLINLVTSLKKLNRLPHKFIFSSTISIYGEKYTNSLYTEVSDKSPKSPYAITKLEGEEFLSTNIHDGLFILRFSPVYSNDFMLNILRRTKIKNYNYRIGSGNNKLSLLSIDNIVTTIEAIINDKVPCDIYNVSDETPYTYKELLEFVNAKSVLQIPRMLILILFYLNKIIKNNFINENTIKLLTDNVYPPDKLLKFVKLPNRLN